jgi:hypothetical protein
MGSYVIWDKARAVHPEQSVLDLGKEMAIKQDQNVLVILNYVPDQPPEEVASFTGSIVGDEDYYIYLVHPGMPPPDKVDDSTVPAINQVQLQGGRR